MVSREIEVINKLGLHARASSKLVQLANKFQSEIFVVKKEKKANAKSIMSLMMLAANKGTQVEISCDGADEADALNSVCGLFADRFGENE